MFYYKIDILARLSDKGYTQYKLQKDKIIGNRSIDALRAFQPVGLKTIIKCCELLGCDIGDLITINKRKAYKGNN